MIEHNNPAINVDELMAKVHAAVGRRHFPAGSGTAAAALPADALATIASIESSLDAATEKAQIRTTWSGRLNRFPFNASPFLRRLSLKILSFVFKDQRHVNFAIIQALRDSVEMNVRLAEQVDQLRARLNQVDDRTACLELPPETGRNGSAAH